MSVGIGTTPAVQDGREVCICSVYRPWLVDRRAIATGDTDLAAVEIGLLHSHLAEKHH